MTWLSPWSSKSTTQLGETNKPITSCIGLRRRVALWLYKPLWSSSVKLHGGVKPRLAGAEKAQTCRCDTLWYSRYLDVVISPQYYTFLPSLDVWGALSRRMLLKSWSRLSSTLESLETCGPGHRCWKLLLYLFFIVYYEPKTHHVTFAFIFCRREMRAAGWTSLLFQKKVRDVSPLLRRAFLFSLFCFHLFIHFFFCIRGTPTVPVRVSRHFAGCCNTFHGFSNGQTNTERWKNGSRDG